MKKHLLFTYGTLRAAHANSARNGLTPDKLVATDVILPDFSVFNLGWFPGVRIEQGAKTIGDLWYVTDDDLPGLDRYEGVPHLYRREIVTIKGYGEVFVYVYNNNSQQHRTIDSGDWLKHMELLRHAN